MKRKLFVIATIPIVLVTGILLSILVQKNNVEEKSVSDILKAYDENYSNQIPLELSLTQIKQGNNYAKEVFKGNNFSIVAIAKDEESAYLSAGNCSVYAPLYYIVKEEKASQLDVDKVFQLASPETSQEYIEWLKVNNSLSVNVCGVEKFFTLEDSNYKPSKPNCRIDATANLKTTIEDVNGIKRISYFFENKNLGTLSKQIVEINNEKVDFQIPEVVYECE